MREINREGAKIAKNLREIVRICLVLAILGRMADFHQSGVISTLHRLGDVDLEDLEAKLKEYVQTRPIALVLPCLFSELQGEAMRRIVDELTRAEYIDQAVVSMDRMDRSQSKEAAQFFSALPQRRRILWHDGPRIRRLIEELERNELSIGPQGKGRGCWLSFGYVLACNRQQVIALHDCDILSYNRELLARLCYPIANSVLGYEFCKGYYARFQNRLYGRVTRLFLTPLIRALTQLAGHIPLLNYMDSFRYPLAGEFAMTTDLARVNRIPAHWGLEVGVLYEVYRNCSLKRICQVDLADTYEHKHQRLSARDPGKGLMKMAVDIADSLLRTLASEGVVMSEAFFRTLQTAYQRSAEDIIKRYHDDAAINGLEFDRHTENQAVETFRRALRIAAERFVEDPLGAPVIPNWNRVNAALPDFLDRLYEAVEGDNRSMPGFRAD